MVFEHILNPIGLPPGSEVHKTKHDRSAPRNCYKGLQSIKYEIKIYNYCFFRFRVRSNILCFPTIICADNRDPGFKV